MSRLWSPQIANDPEKFVLFAFPWGERGTPLERHKGPRAWQRQVLREGLGREMQLRALQGLPRC